MKNPGELERSWFSDEKYIIRAYNKNGIEYEFRIARKPESISNDKIFCEVFCNVEVNFKKATMKFFPSEGIVWKEGTEKPLSEINGCYVYEDKYLYINYFNDVLEIRMGDNALVVFDLKNEVIIGGKG